MRKQKTTRRAKSPARQLQEGGASPRKASKAPVTVRRTSKRLNVQAIPAGLTEQILSDWDKNRPIASEP